MARAAFKVTTDEGDQVRRARCVDGLDDAGNPVVDPATGMPGTACGWTTDDGVDTGDSKSVKSQGRDHTAQTGHEVRVTATKETVYTGTAR